jgi:hypothetical protein
MVVGHTIGLSLPKICNLHVVCLDHISDIGWVKVKDTIGCKSQVKKLLIAPAGM